VTPNRLNGPHDISKYFDDIATGFHLKEYTTSELAALFKEAGFCKIRACIAIKGLYVLVPIFPINLLEALLTKLPARSRKNIASRFPFDRVLGIILVGTK
jgi:hypothetical protein